MICIEWIGMVRPRRLVRAAPPQLSFCPAGGALLDVDWGSLLDAVQHTRRNSQQDCQQPPQPTEDFPEPRYNCVIPTGRSIDPLLGFTD